jgi:hypothetical protein
VVGHPEARHVLERLGSRIMPAGRRAGEQQVDGAGDQLDVPPFLGRYD